jgi:hypothetical protein
MKRLVPAVAVLLLIGGGLAVWRGMPRFSSGDRAPAGGAVGAAGRGGADPVAAPRAMAASPDAPLSSEEIMTRADKIRRDYDEITSRASADYTAAGAAFPGGLNAFLRQLALLAREKHRDLAALLTPRELEDLELRDTNAGQMVQRWLGDTTATDEQRRAVFRLEQSFEDAFALTFDVSPLALLVRERERQATQFNIRRVLGDDLFRSWLRGEGTDFATIVEFAREKRLAATVPLELWRAKCDYSLARLELQARADLPPSARVFAEATLATQANARVAGIVGAQALADGGRDVLTWLPAAAPK